MSRKHCGVNDRTAMRKWKDFLKHVDEKYRQWKLDTKVKESHESMLCFMKYPWNCILWNTLKEKCHNPCLKTFLVAFNISHHSLRTCILERKKIIVTLIEMKRHGVQSGKTMDSAIVSCFCYWVSADFVRLQFYL